jgi:shikimate kinase/3-dehydroquinate synthase
MAEVGGPALVLIGFMGAGKTTTAAQIAAALGRTALDSDRLVEERLGRSIASEVEERGEGRFRQVEEEVVLDLLDRADRQAVISLGGGSVLSPRVQEALRRHLAVYLELDLTTAWQRVGGERSNRPLARDRSRFEALFQEREPLYNRLAQAVLPAAAPPPLNASQEPYGKRVAWALKALQELPPATRLVWAWSRAAEYPVFIGERLLGSTPVREGAVLPPQLRAGRSFLVADQALAALYGPLLWPQQEVIEVPGGEQSKTVAEAERIWRTLAGAGMRRSDHLVALGGGVIGDLAGFCAATYQRGVQFVQVPTTVVAQVDSAYGGKTGVDLPEAKNYVGAYHQPAAAIADLATLRTLPERERNAGWVEVLKTALIAGGELWERVSAGGSLDGEVVFGCVRTKCRIVASDERDSGLRQVLNLGHTVGHAIEAATGYSRLRHGEAVGLGLLAALRLSSQPGLRALVEELLRERGLPTKLEGVSVAQVVEAIGRDKKRVGEGVPFVLVQAPGKVLSGCPVAQREVEAAVGELLLSKGVRTG